ncbi:NAD(P)-binding protein [Mycena filopes]|nr:NAD(P)-binding protein [Mycena filopes]
MTTPSTTRVWFITGASQGFGRLMTEKALAKGEKVVATLRKPEVLSDLRSQYTEQQLLILRVDVNKSDEILSAFSTAEKTFGRIDVVFNNAGYGIVGEIEGTSDEKARHQFDTNFWGSLTVSKEAVRVFRDVNKPMGGKLLVLSSIYGIDSSPGAGFYAASKFATEAVTEALAKELDPAWNIKIMDLCPGWFKTNLTTVNADVTPVHPAYIENEKLASRQVRNFFLSLFDGSPALQDPAKLIGKFWDLSNVENPPYRIAFGEDAKAVLLGKAAALKADVEASEEWSKDLTF